MLGFRVCVERSGRSGKGAPGHATPLRRQRSPLRSDSPPMLGLAAPSQNSLRSLRSLHSNSCDEPDHDPRCARGHKPWPCRPRRARRPGRSPGAIGPLDRLRPGSPSRRCPGAAWPVRARLCGRQWLFSTRSPSGTARQAVPGGGDLCGGEERRASVGARSALRKRAPSMGAILEVQVLPQAGHSERREAQLREGDRAWEGSVEHKP